MPRLDVHHYLQARAALHAIARPLELRRFEHRFEGAPAWPVIDALSAFQNQDGGFGHGLEPDASTTASGALATSVALGRLAEVGAPASHPTVSAAMAYLEATLAASTRTWQIVPDATADAPHAPWWSLDGLAERFHGFTLNPKADIVAQLYALGPAADEAWLRSLADDVVREVRRRVRTSSAPLEMHDLICVCRLVDAANVPPTVRDELLDLVAPVAVASVARTPEDYAGYGLRPLSLAPKPTSALADTLAEAIAVNLDHLIATQGDDGAWWPVWSWGNDADEAWQRAKRAWAGVLTLDALEWLDAYVRLDRE